MWFRNIFRRRENKEVPDEGVPAAPDVSLPPRLISQLNRLRLNSTQYLRGKGSGQRLSNRRRPSMDFREHRKYVAGDDIRYVDWKTSARSEHVYLKQGEHPQENMIHLVLDTSSSMNWGSPPKSKTALELAAALGYLALNNDDRLHVMPFENRNSQKKGKKTQKTLKGKGQYPVLLKELRKISFRERGSLASTIRRLTQFHNGGVVFILSDLLDMTDLEGALMMLPPPAWKINVLHLLHPNEINPDIQGELELIDIESGEYRNYDINQEALEEYNHHFNAWQKPIELACIRHNALYKLLPTNASFNRKIIPELLKLDILEIAYD